MLILNDSKIVQFVTCLYASWKGFMPYTGHSKGLQIWQLHRQSPPDIAFSRCATDVILREKISVATELDRHHGALFPSGGQMGGYWAGTGSQDYSRFCGCKMGEGSKPHKARREATLGF